MPKWFKCVCGSQRDYQCTSEKKEAVEKLWYISHRSQIKNFLWHAFRRLSHKYNMSVDDSISYSGYLKVPRNIYYSSPYHSPISVESSIRISGMHKTKNSVQPTCFCSVLFYPRFPLVFASWSLFLTVGACVIFCGPRIGCHSTIKDVIKFNRFIYMNCSC